MAATKRLIMRVPDDLLVELKARALREGVSVAALMLRPWGREPRPEGRPRKVEATRRQVQTETARPR